MRLMLKQAEVWRMLPLLAAVCILAGGKSYGEEKFPNELNSSVDEPQVVIHENSTTVPIRAASVEIQRSTDPLVKLAYETREAQRRRLLSTADHTPWQMMHGLLGLRQDFLISHNGETVNGLDWIKTGPMFQNEPWFQKTAFGGQAHPYNKPYWFEGHINQFLAILAMCNVPLDTQFGTPQGPITMRDMLKNAQMTANEKEEVTWTLWALATYLPSDAEWINAKGERWSIEKLVRLEVGKKVGGPTSPCGGTHGLFALARARNVYLSTRRPLKGVWLEAEYKIQKYIETARVNQNSNGTLSSNFFRGREYKQDFDKRMASSGHVLEFMMMALPDERLKEQWVRRAIEATANDLMANRKAYVSCSPLYHATNALSIYLDRVVPASQQAALNNPAGTRSISNSKNLPGNAGATNTPDPAPTAGASATPQTAMSPKTDAPKSETPRTDAPKTAAATGEPSPSTTPSGTKDAATSAAKTEDVRIDQEKSATAKPGDVKPADSPLQKIPLPDPAADDSAPAGPNPAVPATTSPGTEVPPSKVPDKDAAADTTKPVTEPPTPAPVPVPAPVVAESSAATVEPARLPEIASSPITAADGVQPTPVADETGIDMKPIEVPMVVDAATTDTATTPAPAAETAEVVTVERTENPILFIGSMMPVVASAKAVTIVMAKNASLQSEKSAAGSTEMSLTTAGPAEAVSPMVTPKALSSSHAKPQVPVTTPASTNASPEPDQEKEKTPEPDSRRYGSWKSTPPERRRAIIVEAAAGI